MQCSCLSWSSNPKLAPSFPKSKLSSINIAEAIDFTGRIPLPSHVKAITSISNPFVKHCVKLRFSSSYRHFHGSVVVVGATPIREICKFQESLHGVTCTLECLLLLDEVEVPEGLVNLTVRIVRVSSAVMKKLSGLQSTESIDAIALMRIPPSFCSVDGNEKEVDFKRWFPSPHRILVLEGIQDPGNLGTLIRSALAFKWNGIFLLPGCCDPFNEKALRASRGASFQLPIVSGTWNHLEVFKKEFEMKMLAGHPESNEPKPVSVLSQQFSNSLKDFPLCLVLGCEGSGLSEKSWQVCELLSIPMAGGFESLNVSVAGGIFLYMLQAEIP
ncbi:uncharacterized protein LOC101218901 isoform X2 [Cucumis sativus]|uniref:uncharacterized protein LOC101218901 isoform X2 n=1 Tax=Cucumis sativus TaxID=3659 RepID=UPI0002B42FF8|nr:uncharacterized protein LOC101218901 isoform X2 [Cucumis sativus]KAE8650203.1 hypothetical protein Csa_010011 [Cucumis sativus]